MTWYKSVGFTVVAAAVITFTGFALKNLIPWCKTTEIACHMGAAEWAYWVAAIGTVGTLIGTIWIATSESRRRKKESLNAAQIAAAQMQYPLLQNAKQLTKIIEQLIDFQTRLLGQEAIAQQMPRNCKNLGERLLALHTWSSQDLISLLPLDKEVSFGVSIAQSKILLLGREFLLIETTADSVADISKLIELAIPILTSMNEAFKIAGIRLGEKLTDKNQEPSI